MAAGTLGVKSLQVFIYAIAFLCSAIILGIYSYFLATQHQHNVSIPNTQRAIEGISGSGALYTIFALVLTCCLGGLPFFAFIGIVLDVCFTGGFVAIAILTRDGSSSCTGHTIKTPLGSGSPSSHHGNGGAIYTPSLKTVCRLETACFAVAILGAFIFLLAAIVQLWLGRRHQRDKRYGPSPANNYTAGTGVGWFKRRRARRSARARAVTDTEAAGTIPIGGLAAAEAGGHHHHYANGRDSYGTATTADSYVGNKYETAQYARDGVAAPVGVPVAGGYHTGPAGAEVNPYEYENTRSHGTAI